MIQFFKNVNHQTVEVDHAEDAAWVNVLIRCRPVAGRVRPVSARRHGERRR